ncbi:response regulator transcription factor [Rhodanobacter sp. 7MK24]|uniref:response regulator n=1 Tax=Rhodanobacter sp. 7MK24 TaxID=2775922 RepID=UPI00177F46FF|nr:response regulator transcription factor [Rhodanobacter sp. 7MK24]MBD8880796.1 response regulator transcription factor [Rhodanobacter sp. 7MK24]
MSSSDSEVITVLVVDDHPLLRDGVAFALSGESDMRIVANAEDGESAIAAFREHRPDVTLMDLQLPDMSGVDAMCAIRSEFPAARVLVLTTYRGDVQVTNALKRGASGFLLKASLRKELRDAIRAVNVGRRVISPDAASDLAEHVGGDVLSERELQVLDRAARGNGNKQIASKLGISEDTVKSHMKSILSKLDANDRTHAVVTALKRGIIHI